MCCRCKTQDQIAALGPWGAALFVVTVMTAEMVPLFPTQPLMLASGLLFGPVKGAVVVVLGVTLAAVNAFSLARGVGRQLAEKVIAHEVGDSAAGGGAGLVSQQLAAVNKAIESGGFRQQVAAITLLRLTPVVPFSASNYLLGLTPVQRGPMLLGTVTGMSVWSILYASLGGASRSLLDGGADLDVLLEDLTDKAGQYSSDVAVCGLLLGIVAGGYWFLNQQLQSRGSPEASSNSSSQQPPLPSLDPGTPSAPGTPNEALQRK
ncbi:snare associated Golgi protein-domain-containing protein [Scenedesmus sp. NREL 46B-D3]|nr:snare associated Golgi protein-domain-containing protein [Scenedesmus sp. NREL 46B-D3]